MLRVARIKGAAVSPSARLPSWPAEAAPPFDLVVLARFSADYLAPAELDALATRLATVLRPGGVWTVELQDRRSVENGHRELAIRVVPHPLDVI